MILPLSVTSTFFFILNVCKIRPASVGREEDLFFGCGNKRGDEGLNYMECRTDLTLFNREDNSLYCKWNKICD